MKTTNTLKEKSKEIFSLSTYVIVATLITSPFAFAAPFLVNPGTVNTNLKGNGDSASGCSSSSTLISCFSASSGDDLLSGVPQGSIGVVSYSPDFTNFSQIYCSGSAYAGIVSVNAGNGTMSLKATINPSDPLCFKNNWNLGTVTLNLSGNYTNEADRFSLSGQSKTYSNGAMYTSTYESHEFYETFTGSITGFSGPWSGAAYAHRFTNRQRVK